MRIVGFRPARAGCMEVGTSTGVCGRGDGWITLLFLSGSFGFGGMCGGVLDECFSYSGFCAWVVWGERDLGGWGWSIIIVLVHINL